MLIPSLLRSRATSPTILHEERFEVPQNHDACLAQLIGVQFLSVSCRSYLSAIGFNQLGYSQKFPYHLAH